MGMLSEFFILGLEIGNACTLDYDPPMGGKDRHGLRVPEAFLAAASRDVRRNCRLRSTYATIRDQARSMSNGMRLLISWVPMHLAAPGSTSHRTDKLS